MAIGRKTGGRQKGGRNKKTLAREAAIKAAVSNIKQAGGEVAECDAHGLLIMIYMNDELPIEMRLDAAKAAIRFEVPALASTESTNTETTRYVVALPDGEISMDEWKAKYSPEAEAKH